jgi:hypothetical protein
MSSLSYGGAVFKLDSRTGIRADGTLWHCGHFVDAIIEKNNSTERRVLLFSAKNNGYEKPAFGAIDLDKIRGRTSSPSTGNYAYYNMHTAGFTSYILLPSTDFASAMRQRGSGVSGHQLRKSPSENTFIVVTDEGDPGTNLSIIYSVNRNFKDIDIVITDKFRVARDSLVAQKKLLPPYSDTPEYIRILKERTLYWENDSLGGRFVKREELK